jgi:hypothetical protein
MRTEVIMVLGRVVWRRGEGGWYHQSPLDLGGSLAAFVQEAVARSGAGRIVLIYEPAGMAHQEVECPKAGRRVFASISRIRSEFPVVVSEDLGWGMEPPVLVAGGSYSTLVHYELSGGLADACSSPDATGLGVAAAWSAFTLAESCLSRRLPAARDGSVLILLPGLVAFAAGNRGRRSFRVFPQPMAERDWRALVYLTSGPDEPPGREEGRRGGVIAVVSVGEPTSLCPVWEEIRNAGRLECFIGLDEFADCASRMPRTHPANLILGFPAPISLDPILSGAAATAAVIALFAVVSLRARTAEFHRLESESLERSSELQWKVGALEKNRLEFDSLQRDLPEAPGAMPAAKSSALRALAAAIPDSLTLTRFRMEGDDRFELEAVLVGREFDKDSVVLGLAQSGLSAAPPGSSAFDPGSRKLTVRGKFTAPAQ